MNRATFFDTVRGSLYAGALKAGQVDGLTRILTEAERRGLPIAFCAYILATAHHETAKAMQPVIETRQPGEATNPSVDEAIRRLEKAWASGKMKWVKTAYWRKDEAGFSWLGRGLPQVTHRTNYERAERELGVPFTKRPELMLEIEHAVPVAFEGMIKGWFTGKKLSDYLSGTKPDYLSARRIINRTESAATVGSYAAKFETALRAAGYSAGPVAARVSTPAPESVIQPTPSNDNAPGFWARLWAAFRSAA